MVTKSLGDLGDLTPPGGRDSHPQQPGRGCTGNRYEWADTFRGEKMTKHVTHGFSFLNNVRGKAVSSDLRVRVGGEWGLAYSGTIGGLDEKV